MDSKTKELIKKRQQLLQRLAGLKLLMHGSYFERFSTCSRKQCACHQGRKHGPRSYLVVYRQARQHQVYVPRKQVPTLQRGLLQDEQAADLVRQITDVNLALMRAGHLEDSQQEPREEKA